MVAFLLVLPFTMTVGRPWPLRLAFAASRPALERLADRVEGGDILRRPEWAGIYWVVAAEFDAKTGNLALIIDDSRNKSAFVRLPSAASRETNGPLYFSFFDETMGGRGRYQSQ